MWNPVSKTAIERDHPSARIEITRTDSKYKITATVEGETYKTRTAVTKGGARTEAKLLAEEINEKGESIVESSESEKHSSSEERKGEEKEETKHSEDKWREKIKGRMKK